MNPTTLIEDALAHHGRGVLSFSAGKDSVAVLHHSRPFADRLKVIFVEFSDGFPHVAEYARRICDLWNFELEIVETEPPRHALPSDMVPTWSTPFADWFLPEESKPQTQIISSIDCCNVTLWQPLDQAIKESGTTLVLRGSKGTDEHISIRNGSVVNGIEYVNPLWDWTDTQVYQYLDSMAVPLPHQYQVGVNTSLDCATCCGWLNTPAEVQRLEYTKRYHPEAFAVMQQKMRLVLGETQRRSAELLPAIFSLFPGADTSRTPEACTPPCDDRRRPLFQELFALGIYPVS